VKFPGPTRQFLPPSFMADGDGTGFDSGLAVRRAASPPTSPRRGATQLPAIPESRAHGRGAACYGAGMSLFHPVSFGPAVREAIEEERWADVDRYATLTSAALDAYADKLDEGVRLMGEAGSAAHDG
jgi:hypothetical protein